MEEQQIYHRHRDVCVGQVEYRTEEVVVVVYKERQPVGHAIPLEEREVEHIDHLTHQECAVTLAECSNGERRRSREYHSVEHRIDEITHRAGQNQCQAHNHTTRRLALGAVEVVNIVTQKSNHHHAKEAEQELAPVDCARCVELHTECCAVVLHEVKVEPGQNLDALVKSHRCFNP